MYSPDLRKRVVAFAKKNGATEAARMFNVGRETVYRWLSNSQPKIRAKRTPHKLPDAKVLEAVSARPDATLKELASGFNVSPNAVFKALKRLHISRKKNQEIHGKMLQKTS
jgi:putative transposase